MRAFAQHDAPILAELQRLAQVTGRWEDFLSVEGFRFHRAADSDKLPIACEAAALVEEKLHDRLRAFRAYLRAYLLAPEDDTIRAHLWRLARLIDNIDESTKISKPATAAAAAPPPIKFHPAPRPDAEGAGRAHEPPRRDSTVELTLMDLVAIQQSGPINLFPEDIEQEEAAAAAAGAGGRRPAQRVGFRASVTARWGRTLATRRTSGASWPWPRCGKKAPAI